MWLKALAIATVLSNLVIIPSFGYKIVLNQETGWTVLATQTLGPILLIIFEIAVIIVSVLLLKGKQTQTINQGNPSSL
jgi:hypothetical protein